MKIYNKNKKEWVELKEFFHQWKVGMQNISPLQQCISIQFGQVVSLIGVVWGIIFSIRLAYWWMAVILVGGVIILAVQMLGNWQKKMILKNLDKITMEVENGHAEFSR